MLTLADVLGYSAAFFTTIAFLPQAIKTLKTRETRALSLGMYSFFTLGVILWFFYGMARNDPAIIGANLVTGTLAMIILVIKIKNDYLNKTL